MDNIGRAMGCFITADGQAYEYHDGGQLQLLYSTNASDNSPIAAKVGVRVVDAKAGQGVSYVLLSNEVVYEYVDATSKPNAHAAKVVKQDTCVVVIDAGTTVQGVNVVDEIYHKTGEAFELPDNGSKHSFGLFNVKQVSAGRQGVSALLDSNGTAHVYQDGRGFLGDTWTNVAQLSSGFSADGTY